MYSNLSPRSLIKTLWRMQMHVTWRSSSMFSFQYHVDHTCGSSRLFLLVQCSPLWQTHTRVILLLCCLMFDNMIDAYTRHTSSSLFIIRQYGGRICTPHMFLLIHRTTICRTHTRALYVLPRPIFNIMVDAYTRHTCFSFLVLPIDFRTRKDPPGLVFLL